MIQTIEAAQTLIKTYVIIAVVVYIEATNVLNFGSVSLSHRTFNIKL